MSVVKHCFHGLPEGCEERTLSLQLLSAVRCITSARALFLRRLLMERRTMFARSGTAASDLLRKWSALRAIVRYLRIVP